MTRDTPASEMTERERRDAMGDVWTALLRAAEEKGEPLTRDEEDRVIDGRVRWDGRAFGAANAAE